MGEKTEYKSGKPIFQIRRDFLLYPQNGLLPNDQLSIFCEVSMIVDKAHKAVLACRSPVFAAMFTNGTEEKQTGRVNFPDISAPVLGQLLHFVYTGCEPKLLAEQGMAEGLLVAADKYQLDRLKAMCEEQLCQGLNKDNVCDVLALADLHSAEHLKSRAIEYINLHSDEVNQSEGWPTFVSSHPELLKQLGKGLSAKQRQQS